MANRRALHLLWTIPLAALISTPVFFISAIELCGISGCSGCGFFIWELRENA